MLSPIGFFLVICALSVPASAGANPFAGTWKFNRTKSDMRAQTVTITALGDNRFTLTYSDVCSVEIAVTCGSEITMKNQADGTDQPFFPSSTWAITIKDPVTWEIVHKTNGNKIGTETWAISGDGTTMSQTFVGGPQRPDGSAISSASTMKRLSGSTGFAGKWWIKDVSPGNEYEQGLQIEAPVPGVLVINRPNMTVTFDGTDFPAQGSQFPPFGSVASAQLINSHLMKIAYKRGGNPLATTTWAVSSDGKILRVTEQRSSPRTVIVSVYDRQ